MRISDWSSDVCSSDLGVPVVGPLLDGALQLGQLSPVQRRDQVSPAQVAVDAVAVDPVGNGGDRLADRKSVVSGKSVSVRVDLGGRRILKKTKKLHTHILDSRTIIYYHYITPL